MGLVGLGPTYLYPLFNIIYIMRIRIVAAKFRCPLLAKFKCPLWGAKRVVSGSLFGVWRLQMRQNARVTFAMRDLDRLKCIQAVVDGDLKPIRAADRLGLTTRQVRRLARRYAAAGPVGLLSKRFNRPSNNRLDDALANQGIKILRSTYADFGPTLATEKLRTKHGIDLAKETVRRLQIAVGLWIRRKLRPPKIQQPRLRRACVGELIQIDGCEHHWFEERGPAST